MMHISFVCSRISRDTGIIWKLRYYLSVKQLRQIYYDLIYPHSSGGMLAWGSVYKTHISKIVQVKQNQIVRLIVFATALGNETAKAKPLLHLLGLSIVDNIYRLQVSQCVHSWRKICLKYSTTCFNMLAIYIATIQDIQLRKIR